MTEDGKPSRQQLMDEAADWLARLDSGSADPKDFEAWRSADPRRASAFVQVANAAQAIDRAKPVLKDRSQPAAPDRRNLLSVGVMAGIGLIASGVAVGLWATRRAEASTGIGQRRVIVLPNRATLELNTNSKAAWRLADGLMTIWLERGEIAVTVNAPDQACLVCSGVTVADVRGGRVNARLRGALLDLTVIGGQTTVRQKVPALQAGGARSAPVTLQANQAILSGTDNPAVRTLTSQDVQFISGWSNGELAFEGQTLDTAVGEYNRYLSHKIIVADPSLASLRLGGRFSTTDPSVFLEALRSAFGIKVATDDDGTVVLTK